MESDVTDEQLVKMSLAQREFFGSLVVRYEQKLSRYITRLGVQNEEDRLDVLQEIFIKAYKNLHGFDKNLSFSSWIYRIAHNEAVSWYRKHSVRPEGHLVADSEELLTFLATTEDGGSAEEQLHQSFRKEALEEALLDIDERYRNIIILRFFEHKEYEEISDILKIPIGTVGTMIHRAKKQLKERLIESQTYE